jgi:preprotein translocase subunit Sec61beta
VSKKSRRREEGVMPATGAGLMRFFQDDMKGVKFGPGVVTVLSVGLIMILQHTPHLGRNKGDGGCTSLVVRYLDPQYCIQVHEY